VVEVPAIVATKAFVMNRRSWIAAELAKWQRHSTIKRIKSETEVGPTAYA
jgi:hypothetical protein